MTNTDQAAKFKILICGGGTGGHLYPAIALVEELKSREPELGKIEFTFIGTRRGLEYKVLRTLGYDLRTIWIRGWQRGWTPRDMLINCLFPLRLIVSFVQSYLIIRQIQPELAIGTGGYTAGPPLRIAAWLGIPYVLHEQNVFPGATTRLLAKHAQRVYTSFSESQAYFEQSVCFGTPLRRSLKHIRQDQAQYYFDLEPGRKTILIFGGSQGSQAINNYWAENIYSLLEKGNCQFIWQTGQRDYETLKTIFDDNPVVHITPFIHEMGIAYCAADLVVSRSGAISLAELCLYGKPAVLIPLPTSAGNHQELNARSMEKNGAAVVVLQSELTGTRLEQAIVEILNDENRLSAMKEAALRLAQPDSARLIIDDIIKIIKKDAQPE